MSGLFGGGPGGATAGPSSRSGGSGGATAGPSSHDDDDDFHDDTVITNTYQVPQQQTTTVAAATAAPPKLPKFWRNSVSMWFAQIEALFDISKITAEKKRYLCVVASLEEDVMLELADVIAKPPTGREYSELKKVMLARFGESVERKLNALLAGLSLGDRTPSSLFRAMAAKAGNDASDKLLLNLWQSRLPDEIVRAVASHDADDVSTETLLKIADNVQMVMQRHNPVVNAVSGGSASTSRAAPTDPLTQLTASIAQLTKRICRMEQSQKGSQGGRQRGHSRQRRSKSRGPDLKNGICYYHRKFGQEAFRCSDGCKFAPAKKQGNASTQH